MTVASLIARYDRRVPRYTSYPTAPHFTDAVTPALHAAWLGALRDRAVEIARSTAAWQWSAKVAAEIRAWFRGLIQSAR